MCPCNTLLHYSCSHSVAASGLVRKYTDTVDEEEEGAIVLQNRTEGGWVMMDSRELCVCVSLCVGRVYTNSFFTLKLLPEA